jgi:glycosyltransferase involved in cell wall biosynthesis
MKLLEKETLKCHLDWIAVSKWISKETQDFFNVTPSRSQVIYNPVVISKGNDAIPFPMPDCYVLYAGTVSDRKGAFVLAEAARSFFAAFPSIHLVYVGGLSNEGGQRADETIHQIIGDQFADRVHFTGPVAHDVVLSCMKKARVFVFPSKLESFGLVPVEAMLCGTPVVFSTLHVGPEIIDDGITGLLVDPYNPTDVAEKVMLILTDHAFAARIAEKAKRAVKERFSLKRCIDETIRFYEACLDMKET